MKGTVVFDFDYTLADTAKLKRAIAAVGREEAVSRMSEFLFPGAVAVLRRLRSADWKLGLLTIGEPDWQKRKLGCSGLLPYFDYALYTAEPKETRVAELRGWPGPLVFVNDHGGELDALRQAMPEARMIAVSGPKPPPTDPTVPLCLGLEEVYKILSRG